jgi:integrase
MAKIVTRTWTSRGPTGRRVRHVAYGYDVRINGQRERRFSAEWLTENDALAALVERQREIEAGRIDRLADRTLAELAEEYLAYKEQHGKRSLREDRRIVTTRLLPALGSDDPVRRLTASAIAQYERRRAADVSAFTVANELGVLRHMLRLGKRWGYLDAVPDIDMPKKPEGRTRYLDENEIARLLDACAYSRNPYLAAIVTVALNTGMRKAEILGLEWERVDLSTSRITLYRTKSGKPRGVPLNGAVYDALVALEPDAARRQGRVFARCDGGAWGQVRTAFATALKRGGIEAFRFHDLRHTAASHMVMRGASLKDVQEVLGHADFKMTLRYAHLSPAHLRSAVERLEGLTPSGWTDRNRTLTLAAPGSGARSALERSGREG